MSSPRALASRAVPGRARRRLDAVRDVLPVGVLVVTADGRVADCNPVAARLLGVALHELVGGATYALRWLLSHPDGQPLLTADSPVERVLAGHEAGALEPLAVARRGAARVWVALDARAAVTSEGERLVVVTLTDVTARHVMARALEESSRRFHALATHVPVGILETDAEGACTYANPRCAAVLGLDDPLDAVGEGWLRAFPTDDRDGLLNAWAHAVEHRGPLRHACRVQVPRADDGGPAPDGPAEATLGVAPNAAPDARWVVVSLDPTRDAIGAIVGYVGAIADVSAEKRGEAELRTLALLDGLTGLYNRRGFEAAAGARLAECRRAGVPVAILYLDLDGFKDINDTHGHAAGDAALAAVAQALRECFREDDVVARLGGDEFVALAPLRTPAGVDGVAVLRARIGERLAALAARTGLPFAVRASVGAAVCREHGGRTLVDLLGEADASLYAAKRARRGGPHGA